jgi:hypothetical protein
VLGAGVGVLGAARAVTAGLGDAWKATGQKATGGGGSTAATARRVAAAHREVETATRALADAQRSALEAQLAVTRAREDEAERLDDLARSLAGAKLDEEGAVLAVARAEKELRQVRSRGGNRADIAAADLAYRQSLQTLEEVRDRVQDLTAEQEEGQRKGVEGSDQVQAALRRQQAVADAARRLADAQDAVKEASASAAGGGINPANEALARLSPSARNLILTLRDLAPAWQVAGRAGQEATWRGVAGQIRALSGTYLPVATGWLRRMGNGFNIAIRESLGLAHTNRFVRDAKLLMGNTATATDRLARAFRPVINGIMQFAAVGSTFLPGIAGNTLSLAQRFERWAVAARESGRMEQWISRALGMIRQLGAIAGNVVGSVVAIFRAGENQGTVDGLVKGTAAMRAWLESAEGQQRVSEILSTARSILTGLGDAVLVVSGHTDEFNAGFEVTGEIVKFAADHLDTLAKLLPVIAAGYVISRGAQTAANLAMVIAIPLRIAEVAAMRAHTVALRANTAATRTGTVATVGASAASRASTAATVAGDVATKRSTASLIASKVAMVATAAATKVVTAAQWLWNAAMTANPIGLIILAIIALIAIIVLIATKTTWFQQLWSAVWGFITDVFHRWWAMFSGLWTAIGSFFARLFQSWWSLFTGFWSMIFDKVASGYGWVTGKLAGFVDFVRSLPSKIRTAASGLFDGIVAAAKGGINTVIRLWNRLDLGWRISIPSFVPVIGGQTFSIPDLIPDIPYLAAGGDLTRGGSVVVGDGGEPEIVTLPTGARVTPLSKAGGGAAVLELRGEREIVTFLRRLIKQYRLAEE